MKLAQFEAAWAEAAMQAIFPGSSDQGLADIGAMDVRGFVRDVLRRVPFKAALGLRVAIWVVALAPLLVLGRLTTLARLTLLDRERVLTLLAVSRFYGIRSLVLFLKTMGALLYAGNDAVRARMIAPGAPRSLVRLRVKSVHAA